MVYIQTYTIKEDVFGSQVINAVITDDYSDIAATSGTSINCIRFKSNKEDLNIEENTFGIADISFSIRQSACETDNELNCLNFILESANLENNRFIGIYFGTISTANRVFTGKIEAKTSGQDIVYDDTVWGVDYSKREYSFTALSFDVKILERATFSSKIKKEDGTLIDSVYDRINADLATFETECGVASYISYVSGVNNYRLSEHITIDQSIQAYLDLTNTILTELLGATINFQLQDSNLGYKFNTAKYTLQNYTIPNGVSIDFLIESQEIDSAKITAQWDLTEHLFISKEFISNADFGFKQFENMLEMLGRCARDLGCFITFTENAGVYEVEFKGRQGMIESNFTYIYGFNDGKLDSSNILINDKNQFFGQVNQYASDGYDEIPVNLNGIYKSQKLLDEAESRTKKDKTKELKSERLLFTTSPTVWKGTLIDEYLGYTYNVHLPINIVDNSGNIIKLTSTDVSGSYLGKSEIQFPELFSNAIYMLSTAEPKGTETEVIRPAINITVNINNEDVEFLTLSDFLNYLMKRDIQYYETEYEITVPFWNGFSKSTNGTSPTWKNIRLGSKIRKVDTYKERDINGDWQNIDVTKDYIVVGIERSLEKPETKLTLHSLEKFSFNENTSVFTNAINSYSNINVPNLNHANTLFYEAGETITQGNAVCLRADGKLYNSNDEETDGECKGIALNGGTVGTKIAVKNKGIVFGDYQLSGSSLVFVKNIVGPTGYNITNDWTGFPSSNTAKIKLVGKPITANSFEIDVKDYLYYYEA